MNVAKMDMDKKAVKALLDDKYACIRIAAAEALYQMGEVSTAVGTLTSALKDENMMARVQALNILQLMGDKAQPALTAAKALIPTDPENRDYDVRAAIGLVEELEN